MTDTEKSQEPMLQGAALRPSALREVILDVWQRTRMDWAFVSDRLALQFRNERRLSSQERRFAAETIYGMVRHFRRIDEALAAGGLRTLTRAPDSDRLLAYLVLEAGFPVDDAARHRPGLDWTAVADIDHRIARETSFTRRIALRYSLPDWLAEELARDLGEGAESLAAALNERAPMTVRVNTLVCSREELASELGSEGIESQPGRWSPVALHLRTRINLFGLKAFHAGKFEAQDEGSQLIAELVAPPPKGRVVDYCAGAGGKTLALAALMQSRGRILATDVDARKLSELRRRTRRAHASNVQTAAMSPEATSALEPALAAVEGRAERVLVDAPCTGLGALRRNPEARWRLQPEDLARMPALQRAIAGRALALLAPGGRLIYATCTVLRRENQDVVHSLLAADPTLELMPIKAIWGTERAKQVSEDGVFLQVTPDRHGTDGFFAAVLRKTR